MAAVNPCFVLTVVTFLVLSHCGQSARSPGERECNQIGNIYRNKGFTYPWWELPVPTSSTSGCPARGKALKCCPSTFDTPTHHREISSSLSQKWLGVKLTAAKEIFSERKKKFDMTFKALLQRAHASFHAMFERTYGMLYIQHADVFHALFKTLEKYYDDGRDHLETKLNEFFSMLTRKMFEVLNAQYDFTDSYLSCATIVISEKQGNDLHRQIVSSLRRSFVATRAFAQGLLEAERVISNINKLQFDTTECLIPISQMVNCPICAETRAYKPCLHFCTSITVKCLSPTFLLAKPWNEFSRALEDLTDRLIGPYNVESVVDPIHIKISEAIMNFQESGADLSQAVFSKCGKPTLKSRNFNKREAVAEPRVQASTRRVNEKEDVQPSKSLEKLLRDTKGKVRKSKDFWNVLPRQVCNAVSKDYSSQLCWNGTGTLKLDKDRSSAKGKDSGDGGVSVIMDTQPRGNPTPLISEQILLLQLITDKLKTAFNGGDIQWVQEIDSDDEFGSGLAVGSGSGEIPTDLEDTDDDDPSGDIHKGHKSSSPIPNLNLVPKKPNVIEVEKSNHGFEESTRSPSPPPPLFKPIPVREDEEEENEDEDDDEDGTSNLNINSRNNNNNRPGNNGNDFGVDFPPTSVENQEPSRFPLFPVFTPTPPHSPSTTMTTTRMTTSKTTTTWKPPLMAENPKKESLPIPPNAVPAPPLVKDNPGAKTVAVVNVFTPVIMSMLQKLFNIS